MPGGSRARPAEAWLRPDLRPLAQSQRQDQVTSLRIQNSERQSPEQPGLGLPADPGWMVVALETASCSGPAPAGVTWEDL